MTYEEAWRELKEIVNGNFHATCKLIMMPLGVDAKTGKGVHLHPANAAELRGKAEGLAIVVNDMMRLEDKIEA